MNEFQKKGFKIIRNLVDIKKLYAYTLSVRDKGVLTDMQIPNTPSFYGNAKFDKLHKKILPRIEKETGYKLFKTYNYFRIYKNGDVLRYHTDRPACEISLTLHIGGKDTWEIYVMDKDETPIKVILNPGDALIYMGVERPHWRPKYNGVGDYVQVFLHFVDKNGMYADHKDDAKRQGRQN